jgi:hypothetical protein
VDLLELLGPKKRRTAMDEAGEAERTAAGLAGADIPAAEAGSPGAVPSDAAEGPESDVVAPETDVLRTQQVLESRIEELERQAGAYRQVLEEMGLHAQLLTRKADDDAFLQSMRQRFEKDPVDAVNTMIRKSEGEIWQAVEKRIDRSFRDHRQFKMLLHEFLDDPKNTGLKPHARLIEHLIRDKGVRPDALGDLIRQVEASSGARSRLRAAAAQEIRNRAAVETGGEMGEPVDRDKDLDRVIKQAKTLDELFAGLRSIKI